MNKRTTLGDFVTLIIFSTAVLWVYYKTSVHWSYGEYVPDYDSIGEMFRPSFPAFFQVWPFSFAAGGEILVMLFHLLKDGNVVHYGPSRIGVVFGLCLVGLAVTLLTSPVIFLLWNETFTFMIYLMTSVFMTIYGCLMGASLLLRIINLQLEEGDPSYKRWMDAGGDPVIDELLGHGMGIVRFVVFVIVALLILYFSTLWFCIFLVVCGLVQLFGMIPRL
jgi:hypothetical protein